MAHYATITYMPEVPQPTSEWRAAAGFGAGVLSLLLGATCLGLFMFAELAARQEQGPEAAANMVILPQRVGPVLPIKASNLMAEKVAAKALVAGMLSMGMGVAPSQALEAAMALDSDLTLEQPAAVAPAAVEVAAQVEPLAPIETAPALVETKAAVDVVPALEETARVVTQADGDIEVVGQAPQGDKSQMSFADRVRSRLPQPRKDAPKTNPENLRPADNTVLLITVPFLLLGLGAIAFGSSAFGREQQEAESNWRSADRSSLYFRIGGDALIGPASWVFEDIILSNRTAREVFDGLDRDEARKLQNAFVVAILGGPCDTTAFKALMVKKFCDDPEYDALVSCMVRSFQELDVPNDLILESVARAETVREELLDRKPLRPKA